MGAMTIVGLLCADPGLWVAMLPGFVGEMLTGVIICVGVAMMSVFTELMTIAWACKE